MKIKELKNLLSEFGDCVKFEENLKKIGLILVVKQKFFIRQIILNN